MFQAEKRDLGRKLKDLRIRAGFNKPSDLSDEIGVNRSTVTRAENGEQASSEDTFFKMKEIFRRRSVDEDQLDEFEALWRRARGEVDTRPESLPISEIANIAQSLATWDEPPDRNAAVKDLRAVMDRWHRYRTARKEIDGWASEIALPRLEMLIDEVESQPRLKARVLVATARARRYLGDAKDALDRELSVGLEMAQNLREREPDLYITTLILAGDFNRRLGGLSEALARYDQAVEEILSMTDERKRDLALAEVERKKAGALLFRGEPAEAEKLLLRSIRRCEEHSDLDAKINCEQHLAWARGLLGRYDQALSMQRRALKRVEERHPDLLPEVAKAKRYLADILQTCDQLDEAETLYIEARQHLIDYSGKWLEQETLIRGPILRGLGETYRKQGELVKAQDLLWQGSSISEDDAFFFALTARELGKVASEQGHLEEAERHFDEASLRFEEMGNRLYAAAILVDRSILEMLRGETTKALECANDALELAAYKPDFKVVRIRALGRRAIAGLADGKEIESPVGDIANALRSAEELENHHLLGYVLTEFYDQLQKIKESADVGWFHRLIEEINKLLKGPQSRNPRIQTVLQELHNKFQGMFSNKRG